MEFRSLRTLDIPLCHNNQVPGFKSCKIIKKTWRWVSGKDTFLFCVVMLNRREPPVATCGSLYYKLPFLCCLREMNNATFLNIKLSYEILHSFFFFLIHDLKFKFLKGLNLGIWLCDRCFVILIKCCFSCPTLPSCVCCSCSIVFQSFSTFVLFWRRLRFVLQKMTTSYFTFSVMKLFRK